MNWKLRLKNKTTLITLILAVIGLVYYVLDAAGVIPDIEQEVIIKIATAVVEILCMLGIVVDPTTAGISDSTLAMTYTEPKPKEREQ